MNDLPPLTGDVPEGYLIPVVSDKANIAWLDFTYLIDEITGEIIFGENERDELIAERYVQVVGGAFEPQTIKTIKFE